MVVILPQAFPLGPLDRLNVSKEFLLVLRIDEKPLLELRQSIGLCILALIIAIVGIFVQVKKLLFIPNWITSQISIFSNTNGFLMK
jgi:hypothetical protein